MNEYTDKDREVARQRFVILQVLRFGALGLLLAGIAVARSVIPGPYLLGIVMIGAGLIGFFFGPQALARKFKAGDAGNAGPPEKR